jgi:Cobalamin synthesis protein cobW C-terminal domain.
MSWGVETTHAFDAEALQQALNELDEGQYGLVLRAKGIVPNVRGGWLHFDYVPGEIDVRSGPAAVTGRLCVIGSKLDEHSLPAHFGLN